MKRFPVQRADAIASKLIKHVNELISNNNYKGFLAGLNDNNIVITGFRFFDMLSGGLRFGDFIYLSGNSKHKTNWILNIIANTVLDKKLASLFFLSDSEPNDVTAKLIAISSGLAIDDIAFGNLSVNQCDAISEEINKLSRSHIYFDSNPVYTTDEISRVIREIRHDQTRRLPMIVVVENINKIIHDCKKPSAAIDVIEKLHEIGNENNVILIIMGNQLPQQPLLSSSSLAIKILENFILKKSHMAFHFRDKEITFDDLSSNHNESLDDAFYIETIKGRGSRSAKLSYKENPENFIIKEHPLGAYFQVSGKLLGGSDSDSDSSGLPQKLDPVLL